MCSQRQTIKLLSSRFSIASKIQSLGIQIQSQRETRDSLSQMNCPSPAAWPWALSQPAPVLSCLSQLPVSSHKSCCSQTQMPTQTRPSILPVTSGILLSSAWVAAASTCHQHTLTREGWVLYRTLTCDFLPLPFFCCS